MRRPDPPFILQLQQVDGDLRLGLANRWDSPEIYLMDALIQPSVLVVKDPTGNRVLPFDNRPTPQKLPNNLFDIHWGQLIYKNLKPGRYDIYVE